MQQEMLGKTLGCYSISEIIARGKTAVIYKAQDGWMNRTVAIKMLHLHFLDDELTIQLFNQQAKVMGKIEHPNVIQAYDFGIAPETEQPFVCMEYLDGRNLQAVIEAEGQIDAQRVGNIFLQACEAISAVHAKKIIHGNLNPRHIMLLKTVDSPEFVKILDFHLARVMPASANLTQLPQRESSGTPFYMSPEQFIGKHVGPQSDVYAVGCLMYEALTGKPPIVADNILETMYSHMNERPKPPSEVRPELNIPAKLEAVVMRALEKDPAQRYQTASEMHHDLLRAQAGFVDTRSLQEKLRGAFSSFRRLRKRHEELLNNALLVVLCFIMCGCLVGFGLMLFRDTHSSRAIDPSERSDAR